MQVHFIKVYINLENDVEEGGRGGEGGERMRGKRMWVHESENEGVKEGREWVNR